MINSQLFRNTGGFIIALLFSSCLHDKADVAPDFNAYPPEIGKIVLTQCAVTGCHNDKSKDAAAGLSMLTWERLMEGSRNNAAVIPFNAEQSFLMPFINTYSDLGTSANPTMPINGNPLSREQVILFRDWINAGAPSSSGKIAFADNPNRRKMYIVNQGCDLVSVVDLESRIVMRYVEAGSTSAIESPHHVKVSPDKQNWYVCLTAGSKFQKFSCIDDSYVGEIEIGFGNWNTFMITSDSRKAFVVDWSSNGSVAYVDLENLTLIKKIQGSNLLIQPHGSMLINDKVLLVTSQVGNYYYKIDFTNLNFVDVQEVSLVPGQSWSSTPSLDPHDIVKSPDGSMFAVTCQRSNEIRFYETAGSNAFLGSLPTGLRPQEIAFSASTGLAFVTCTEDSTTFTGKYGSVYIYNYLTRTFIKSIYAGHQPHGIAVDEVNKLVYVANRNTGTNGPLPHHSSACGGRNGYLTAIDLNTLELKTGIRAELSVDPYFMAVRD